MPARPRRRPLAVRPAVGIADRLADGCVSQAAVRQLDRTPDGGGRPYGCPPRPFDKPSARSSARQSAPAVRYGRFTEPTARQTASSVPRPSARPSTTRTASSLIPAPGSLPPPPPTVLSTVGFLGEYKEGNTTTLNLLPNLCFPRALSCSLHLLLGKPLLRKSEIVLGVSFGTPNTISAAWLLHSFIPYFCPHRNGQQTMVPLVH